MDPKKRRTSLRKSIYSRDDENVACVTPRLKRRISFSERHSVREFHREEEPKTWENSYEISDHLNVDGTNSKLCTVKQNKECSNKKLSNEDIINKITSTAAAKCIQDQAQNAVHLSSTSDLIDMSYQNSMLYIENSVDITLFEKEKQSVKRMISQQQIKKPPTIINSFSLDENELRPATCVYNSVLGERTADFMLETENNQKEVSKNQILDIKYTSPTNLPQDKDDTICKPVEIYKYCLDENKSRGDKGAVTIYTNDSLLSTPAKLSKRKTIKSSIAMELSPDQHGDSNKENIYSILDITETVELPNAEKETKEFEKKLDYLMQHSEQNMMTEYTYLPKKNVSEAEEILRRRGTNNLKKFMSTKLPAPNTESSITIAGNVQKTNLPPKLVVRKICTPITHKEIDVNKYEEQNASSRIDKISVTNTIESDLGISLNFSLSGVKESSLSSDSFSQLIPSEYKEYNFKQLNDEIERGKIQLFPKTPTTDRKSKECIYFTSKSSQVLKERRTLFFEDSIPITPDKSVQNENKILDSKNFYEFNDSRGNVQNKRPNYTKCRFSQADDHMLDNTSFLTRAKLDDETSSRNTTKRGPYQLNDLEIFDETLNEAASHMGCVIIKTKEGSNTTSCSLHSMFKDAKPAFGQVIASIKDSFMDIKEYNPDKNDVLCIEDSYRKRRPTVLLNEDIVLSENEWENSYAGSKSENSLRTIIDHIDIEEELNNSQENRLVNEVMLQHSDKIDADKFQISPSMQVAFFFKDMTDQNCQRSYAVPTDESIELCVDDSMSLTKNSVAVEVGKKRPLLSNKHLSIGSENHFTVIDNEILSAKGDLGNKTDNNSWCILNDKVDTHNSAKPSRRTLPFKNSYVVCEEVAKEQENIHPAYKTEFETNDADNKSAIGFVTSQSNTLSRHVATAAGMDIHKVLSDHKYPGTIKPAQSQRTRYFVGENNIDTSHTSDSIYKQTLSQNEQEQRNSKHCSENNIDGKEQSTNSMHFPDVNMDIDNSIYYNHNLSNNYPILEKAWFHRHQINDKCLQNSIVNDVGHEPNKESVSSCVTNLREITQIYNEMKSVVENRNEIKPFLISNLTKTSSKSTSNRGNLLNFRGTGFDNMGTKNSMMYNSKINNDEILQATIYEHNEGNEKCLNKELVKVRKTILFSFDMDLDTSIDKINAAEQCTIITRNKTSSETKSKMENLLDSREMCFEEYNQNQCHDRSLGSATKYETSNYNDESLLKRTTNLLEQKDLSLSKSNGSVMLMHQNHLKLSKNTFLQKNYTNREENTDDHIETSNVLSLKRKTVYYDEKHKDANISHNISLLEKGNEHLQRTVDELSGNRPVAYSEVLMYNENAIQMQLKSLDSENWNKQNLLSTVFKNQIQIGYIPTPRKSLDEFLTNEKRTEQEVANSSVLSIDLCKTPSCSESSMKRLPSNLTPLSSMPKKRQTLQFSVVGCEMDETCLTGDIGELYQKSKDISSDTSTKNKDTKTLSVNLNSQLSLTLSSREKVEKRLSPSNLHSTNEVIDKSVCNYALEDGEHITDSIQEVRRATAVKRCEDVIDPNKLLITEHQLIGQHLKFEDNPVTVSDVSEYFDVQSKSAEVRQFESPIEENKCKSFHRRYINLTCESPLDDIEQTRASLDRTLSDGDEDDNKDPPKCNQIENQVETIDSNEIYPGYMPKPSTKNVRNYNNVHNKCNRCQNTLVNETMSSLDNSFALPSLPLTPSLDLDRLRRLRTHPHIFDVNALWQRLTLNRTIINYNNISDDGSATLSDMEANVEHSKVTEVIRGYKADVLRFHMDATESQLNQLSLNKSSSVCHLNSVLRHYFPNWIFDFQKQHKSTLLITHKKMLTSTVVVTYEEGRGTGAVLQLFSVKYDNSVYQRYWKPIDFILDFQLKLMSPYDLMTLCETKTQKDLFKMMSKIDQIYLEAIQLGINLHRLVFRHGSSIVRDGNRTFVRKIVRRTVTTPGRWKHVEITQFRIEILSIKKLCFRDITMPSLYNFSEDIQLLPVGLTFLEKFLQNPLSYLKGE